MNDVDDVNKAIETTGKKITMAMKELNLIGMNRHDIMSVCASCINEVDGDAFNPLRLVYVMDEDKPNLHKYVKVPIGLLRYELQLPIRQHIPSPVNEVLILFDKHEIRINVEHPVYPYDTKFPYSLIFKDK